MLGLALREWPDDALRRVLDAPVERWPPGLPVANVGCLYQHGGGRFGKNYGPLLGWMGFHDHVHKGRWVLGYGDNPPRRFDFLCRRFGTPRTVRAIKIRALAILEARRATAHWSRYETLDERRGQPASIGYIVCDGEEPVPDDVA